MDLNSTDYDQRTALHLAASEGNAEVALFLLRVPGIDVNPIDNHGCTPLDDAIRSADCVLQAMLEKTGAKRSSQSPNDFGRHCKRKHLEEKKKRFNAKLGKIVAVRHFESGNCLFKQALNLLFIQEILLRFITKTLYANTCCFKFVNAD